MTNLAEMRRIAEAATRIRPWMSEAEGNAIIGNHGGRYIATFDPPTIRALLDVVEAARAGRDYWERTVRNIAPGADPWDERHCTKESRDLIEALARLEALDE